jgi:hypothetical protein
MRLETSWSRLPRPLVRPLRLSRLRVAVGVQEERVGVVHEHSRDYWRINAFRYLALELQLYLDPDWECDIDPNPDGHVDPDSTTRDSRSDAGEELGRFARWVWV